MIAAAAVGEPLPRLCSGSSFSSPAHNVRLKAPHAAQWAAIASKQLSVAFMVFGSGDPLNVHHSLDADNEIMIHLCLKFVE